MLAITIIIMVKFLGLRTVWQVARQWVKSVGSEITVPYIGFVSENGGKHSTKPPGEW